MYYFWWLGRRMYVCMYICTIVRVYHSKINQDIEACGLFQDHAMLSSQSEREPSSTLCRRNRTASPIWAHSTTHSSAQKSAISLNLSQPIKPLNSTNLSVAEQPSPRLLQTATPQTHPNLPPNPAIPLPAQYKPSPAHEDSQSNPSQRRVSLGS